MSRPDSSTLKVASKPALEAAHPAASPEDMPGRCQPGCGRDGGRHVRLQGGRPRQWRHEDFPEKPCKSSQK
jgi:hypothetical protein